jgi:hypothetical protein
MMCRCRQPVVRLEVHCHRLAGQPHPLRAQRAGARLRLRPSRLRAAPKTLLCRPTFSHMRSVDPSAEALPSAWKFVSVCKLRSDHREQRFAEGITFVPCFALSCMVCVMKQDIANHIDDGRWVAFSAMHSLLGCLLSSSRQLPARWWPRAALAPAPAAPPNTLHMTY